MDNIPIGLFAPKARASNRLLYGDLRRLQRDVLPTGARTREEVEALLTLDSIERVDRDWPGYLARVVTEYVLSISEPRGVVDAETAAWLVTALADARPRSAAAIVRALLREAQHVDEAWWHSAGEGRPPCSAGSCDLKKSSGRASNLRQK